MKPPTREDGDQDGRTAAERQREYRRQKALEHHARGVYEDRPGFDFDQDVDGDFVR